MGGTLFTKKTSSTRVTEQKVPGFVVASTNFVPIPFTSSRVVVGKSYFSLDGSGNIEKTSGIPVSCLVQSSFSGVGSTNGRQTSVFRVRVLSSSLVVKAESVIDTNYKRNSAFNQVSGHGSLFVQSLEVGDIIVLEIAGHQNSGAIQVQSVQLILQEGG